VLGCFVSAANVADIKAAPVIWLWALERFSRISKILGDKGYRSRAKAEQLKKGYDCEVEISLRHEQGFEVEPKRWIVERTHSPAGIQERRGWTMPGRCAGTTRDCQRIMRAWSLWQ
jgi:hypothetical protein